MALHKILSEEVAWLSQYDSSRVHALVQACLSADPDLQWLRRQPGYDSSIEQRFTQSRARIARQTLSKISRDYRRIVRLYRASLALETTDVSGRLMRTYMDEAVFVTRLQLCVLFVRVAPISFWRRGLTVAWDSFSEALQRTSLQVAAANL